MADASNWRPTPYPLSWRSWFLRSVLGLLALVLVARLTWGWHVARLLRQEEDRIRARGEPTTLADIVIRDVPDSENAWLLQFQAARSLVPGADCPRNSNVVHAGYPPFSPQWWSMAEASEKAQQLSLTLARQARQRHDARTIMVRPAVLGGLWPPLNQTRTLACVLADGATLSHMRGDDAEAVERLRDILHLGRSLGREGDVIFQLVGIGVDALACSAIQTIAPGLQAAGSSTTRPASAAQVRQLIDELLDEEPCRKGLQGAFAWEWLYHRDEIGQRAAGTWLTLPLRDIELIRYSGTVRQLQAAAAKASWPEARNALPAGSGPATLDWYREAGGPHYSHWYQTGFPFGRFVQQSYRLSGDRRATAVSLAAQLFRIDHGRWPNRLSELVPIYLPTVPADPFHNDGRPLSYVVLKGVLPGGADRPLVYFDAGDVDELAGRNTPLYGWYTTNSPPGAKRPDVVRQYRDLARFERAASTQALDHNP